MSKNTILHFCEYTQWKTPLSLDAAQCLHVYDAILCDWLDFKRQNCSFSQLALWSVPARYMSHRELSAGNTVAFLPVSIV